ncbi:MAG TPA: DegT/DnrJ/EryC1/StrS family aminotransferase [candidate division Zixibacteria bacterium]|nr:DegT/DnrJ/EryC1/StrS family aminotransferase [candidate division Zixibacteria bacterium]
MAAKKTIKIPLFDLKVSAAARREVAEVLNSGWLTTGPKVAAFEKAVGEYLGVNQAVAVSSGTSGLQLLLTAIGAKPGCEIMTTPFTFVATIEAILATGARPVLADIDPATLNIDPEEVARKISSKTLAILPVDIAGYPADYPRLNKIADYHKLPLVTDSAHAIGGRYQNHSTPRLADASVFSFYSTKNLTCGEGGMVVSRHKMVIDAIRSLANHGLTSNAHARKAKGGWQYDAVRPGFKANMSDVAAAIGLGEIKSLDKKQKKRTALAQRYIRNLKQFSRYFELPTVASGFTHGWHLFIIRLHLSELKCDRNKFISLMALRGIECGVHYQPVFELSYYQRLLSLSPNYFPNTTYAGRRVVSLPLYPELTTVQVDQVCEAIEDVLKRYGWK